MADTAIETIEGDNEGQPDLNLAEMPKLPNTTVQFSWPFMTPTLSMTVETGVTSPEQVVVMFVLSSEYKMPDCV